MEQVLDRPVTATARESSLTYYTSQPAPTQWVAVGVITTGTDANGEPRRRLLVGSGKTESAAVAALHHRAASIHA